MGQNVVEKGGDALGCLHDEVPSALEDVRSLAWRRDDRIHKKGHHGPEHDLLDVLHVVSLERRPAMVITRSKDAKAVLGCGEGSPNLLTRSRTALASLER